MLFRLRRNSIRLLCLCAILALFGCSSIAQATPPPPSAQNPAVYPGAQDVQSKEEKYLMVIRFVTNDKPDTVLSYYKRRLVSEGWLFYADLSDSQRETFEWGQSSKEKVYEFHVTVTSAANSDQYSVEVKVVTEILNDRR